AVNASYNEFVREKATVERWFLTDERVMLSEGILPDEINNKKWKPIGEFWKLIVPNYVTSVRDNFKTDVDKMLPELSRLVDLVYTDQYRGSGVRAFYETKRADLRDQVREIRARIEGDLFAEWRNGVKAMHDISRVLASLIAYVDERFVAMDDRIAKL